MPKAAGRRCRGLTPQTHCAVIPAGGMANTPEAPFAKSKVAWPCDVCRQNKFGQNSIFQLSKEGGRPSPGRLPGPGRRQKNTSVSSGQLLSMGAPLLLSAWLCLLAAWGAAGAERFNPPIIIVPGKLVSSLRIMHLLCNVQYQVKGSAVLFKDFCTQTFVLNTFNFYAGLAGSVLEERLNRTNTPHWYCAKEVDDWQTVWLSLQSASRLDCLIDELQVFYDESTGRCVLHSSVAPVRCSRKLCKSCKAFAEFFLHDCSAPACYFGWLSCKQVIPVTRKAAALVVTL